MTTISSRLSAKTSFNQDNFGDDINLSDGAKEYLSRSGTTIETWQKETMANGAVDKTEYFKNPTANAIALLSSNNNSILSICISNDIGVYFPDTAIKIRNLANSCNSLSTEITSFTEHTNRLSGLSPSSARTDGTMLPDHTAVMGVATQTLLILNAADGANDSSVILNNMTSLYVANDIVSHSNTIYMSALTLSPSTSNAQIQVIIDNINAANTLLYTRVSEDIEHFKESSSIVSDHSTLESIRNAGSTSTNIFNNLTGTDKLKGIIASS